MKNILCMTFLLLKVLTILNAQTLLKGQVINEKRMPLGDVSIIEKNTELQTTTDLNGVFTLKVKNKQGIISFSHINYKTKTVHFNVGDTLLVVLEPVMRDLEEVIVYNDGYQSISKERATGSFEQISNKLLQARVSYNIMDRLESTVPGIQFDKRKPGANIIIRGLSSFSEGLQKPLVVLDNFPYDGDLSTLNPNDIESVTILKDAAATSIWGARAGNGVIVLKSKKNLGQSERRFEVGVNYTVLEKPDLSYIQQMSSSDFIDVEQFLYDKGFYKSALSSTNNATSILSPVVKLLWNVDLGKISKEEGLNQIEAFSNQNYRDDISKYFYRLGRNQQYSLSYTTQSKRMSSRLGLGFDRNLDHLVTNQGNRYTLKSDITYRAADRLEIGTSMQYSRSLSDQGASFTYPINPGGNRQMLYPYSRLVGDQHEAISIPYSFNPDFLSSITDPLMDWTMKPYEDIHDTKGLTKVDHLNLTIDFKYKIWDRLQLIGSYGIEKQVQSQELIQTEESFFARNLINLYASQTNGVVNFFVPKGGVKTSSTDQMLSNRGRLQLNYDYVRDQHAFVMLIGSEISKRLSENSGSRVYGYDIYLRTNQPVDYTTLFQTYKGLAGRQSIPYVLSDGLREHRFLSFFGNAVYTLKNRYTISASARRDASNMFGVKTNDRWKPLWSLGAAWVLTKEKWMESIPALNYLKLRWTYGHSGNIGGITGSNPIINYLKPPSGAQTTLPRAFISSLPNPSLKWEDIRMINYGLDFGIFNHKINGTLEYFDKLSTDLLANDLIDPTSGFFNTTKNIGKLKNTGFDLKLSGKVGQGNLLWSPSVFFSSSKNKVLEFYGNLSTGSTYTTNTGNSMRPVKDKSLYPVFSYVFAGLDPIEGDPQGIYKGNLSKDYRNMLRDSIQYLNYHGTALAPYYGAFRNEINWKSLSLSFNISYKFGHYFQKETIRYAALFNSWVSHSDYKKRWEKAGDELITTVPSMKYPADTNRDTFYANSGANIEKSDIVKLQDVQFVFIPNLSKLFAVQKVNMRLFFNVNNVCILWSATKSGYDPDFLGLPNQRNFTIGLNLSY